MKRRVPLTEASILRNILRAELRDLRILTTQIARLRKDIKLRTAYEREPKGPSALIYAAANPARRRAPASKK